MEPTNTNIPQMQPTQSSGKNKMLLLTLLAIIVLGILVYISFASRDKEVVTETEIQRITRQELNKPAPDIVQTPEDVKEELSKPPGGGLTEEEIQRIREELAK